MALVMQELQEMDTHRLVHQPAVPLELGMVATSGSAYNGDKPLRPGVRSLLVEGIRRGCWIDYDYRKQVGIKNVHSATPSVTC